MLTLRASLVPIAITVSVLSSFSVVWSLRRSAISQGRPLPKWRYVAVPGIVALLISAVILIRQI